MQQHVHMWLGPENQSNWNVDVIHTTHVWKVFLPSFRSKVEHMLHARKCNPCAIIMLVTCMSWSIQWFLGHFHAWFTVPVQQLKWNVISCVIPVFLLILCSMSWIKILPWNCNMGNRQQFQILETGKISIGTKENIISRIWTGRKLVLIVG